MANIGVHNVYDSRTPIIWVCSNGTKVQKMDNNLKILLMDSKVNILVVDKNVK